MPDLNTFFHFEANNYNTVPRARKILLVMLDGRVNTEKKTSFRLFNYGMFLNKFVSVFTFVS